MKILNLILAKLLVIFIVLPVLLAIAFVTIAERRLLAIMQRRQGPNEVGFKNKKNSIFIRKRSYHTSNYKSTIENLYINRKAPVIPFEENLLIVCKDLLSPLALSEFFKDLKDKGGIYIFIFKYDPNIYYIGRAKNFKKRFKSHLNVKLTDKFHMFANTVAVPGDKFEFSVVEICSLNVQQEPKEGRLLFIKIFTFIK